MLTLLENHSVNFVKPVVTCLCKEPEGDILREVRLLQFTPSNISKFYHEVSKYKTLFRWEIGGSLRKFMDRLVREGPNGTIVPTGVFYVVDDFVGVFYMTDIEIGVEASVHYSFFNGRHRGRLPLVKAMMRYAFNTYDFRRLNTEIPAYASERTRNFTTEWLGFKLEGIKRKVSEKDGKFFDMNLYGILREEFNGSDNQRSN